MGNASQIFNCPCQSFQVQTEASSSEARCREKQRAWSWLSNKPPTLPSRQRRRRGHALEMMISIRLAANEWESRHRGRGNEGSLPRYPTTSDEGFERGNFGLGWEHELTQDNSILLQRFRVRHGLSCVNGPFWLVRAGCYSRAALSLPHSKPLYFSPLHRESAMQLLVFNFLLLAHKVDGPGNERWRETHPLVLQ